ncbi:MAG: ABC transporter ATP-binding protein [Planctomycetota bacterium]
MNSNGPVLEINDLRKVYGGWFRRRVTALDGISFSVMPGEVFGLLGPNGSGKSTTIKLVLGLLRPTDGSISVLGDVPGSRGALAAIGYLPEENYFQSFLTGAGILDFVGKLYSLSSKERKKRAAELLETVGLREAAGRPLREYSRGMLRRIGIAQALIGKPRLLLMDEPTSGLDPVGNREMKDLFVRLAREGTSVMLSSHLLADIEDICDRIAILDRGKIRRLGKIGELLAVEQALVLKMKSLSEESREELLKEIEKITGERPEAQQSTRSLEDLFLETLKSEDEKDAPDSGGSGDNAS